jgi:hypothetical protein
MPRIPGAFVVVLSVFASGVVACSSAAPSAPPTTAAAPPPATVAARAPASPSASVAASPSPAAAAAPRPANATLTISSPTAGQAVPSGSVQVSLQYSGPALVPAASAAKLDDYHVHYFLDENATPYIGTGVPVPAGNPRIVHSGALQVTFDNVPAGPHTVTVLMSGANHISVAPPLTAQVQFNAQ